jgi:hypothetical protein
MSPPLKPTHELGKLSASSNTMAEASNVYLPSFFMPLLLETGSSYRTF